MPKLEDTLRGDAAASTSHQTVSITDADLANLGQSGGLSVDIGMIYTTIAAILSLFDEAACRYFLVAGKALKTLMKQRAPSGQSLLIKGLTIKQNEDLGAAELNLNRATACIAIHAKVKGYNIETAMYRRMPESIKTALKDYQCCVAPGVHFLYKFAKYGERTGQNKDPIAQAFVKDVEHPKAKIFLACLTVDYMSYVISKNASISFATYCANYSHLEKGTLAAMISNNSANTLEDLELSALEVRWLKLHMGSSEYMSQGKAINNRIQAIMTGIANHN